MPTRTTPLRGSLESQRAWQDRTRAKALRKTRETPRTPSGAGTRTRGTGEKAARDVVYARSEGWCEARIPGVCLGRGTNWHHRRDRTHGGLWTPSNGLHLCGSGIPGHGCHGTLTCPPSGRAAEFERAGWVVASYADPATTPVLHARLGWVLLADDGTTTPAPEAAA